MGGLRTKFSFKKVSRAAAFGAVVVTTKEILAHGLPHEPLELERSSTSESHGPIDAGAEITTLGSVGFAKATTRTEVLGIAFQVEQLASRMQAAFTKPDRRVMLLPTFKVDVDPRMIVTAAVSCDHWQVGEGLP